jgi:hypothetical protein
MIELFILWNLSAARVDASDGENDDLSVGSLLSVWALLQILLWPISMFGLLWKKVGMPWYRALIASAVIMTWGLWLGGENFFFGMGMLAVVAAFSLIAKKVLSNS